MSAGQSVLGGVALFREFKPKELQRLERLTIRRQYRAGETIIHEGKLATLKRFKDEVREVPAGQECGMAFEKYEDMRVGDVIECYRVEEIKRTL